ncbi:MAG TPA: HNH endonuclease signature motif containing protein, partial [Actinomycetes bacterium]|nr:HNH endonuclease signature motif containing protein [Actinomycetes bacterium]
LLTGEIDPPPVSVQVVVPIDVLTGTSDEPAWIPGVGPITAPEARTLAGPSADDPHRTVFRRLLTDPATETLTDIAEEQYRPSARLERAVRARDLTCRFPGCRRPAVGKGTGTDLDHTIPWPEGPTKASNLAALCRRHHRLKHTPGWNVVLHPDGTMTWTTPTGRTYTSEPWRYTESQHQPRGQPPPQLE